MVEKRVTVSSVAGLISEAIAPGHPSMEKQVYQFAWSVIDAVVQPLERRGAHVILDLENKLRDATNPATFDAYTRFVEEAYMPIQRGILESMLFMGLANFPRPHSNIIRAEFDASKECAEFAGLFLKFHDEQGVEAYGKLMAARMQETLRLGFEVYWAGIRLSRAFRRFV